MKPIVIVPPLLVLALAPAAVSLVLLLLPLDEHAVTRTAANIAALLIQVLRLATEPLSLPGGPYRYDLAVLSQPSGTGDQSSPVYSRAARTVFPQPSC